MTFWTLEPLNILSVEASVGWISIVFRKQLVIDMVLYLEFLLKGNAKDRHADLNF